MKGWLQPRNQWALSRLRQTESGGSPPIFDMACLSSALLHFFSVLRVPLLNRLQKKVGTLILTSLLEDLAQNEQSMVPLVLL